MGFSRVRIPEPPCKEILIQNDIIGELDTGFVFVSVFFVFDVRVLISSLEDSTNQSAQP